jgi:hypothetical protein
MVRAAGAVALLALLGIQGAFAQTGGGAQGAQSFTLQPGGTATITFEAFCAQFGEDFPASVQAPASTAPNNVRAALNYARTQGLIGSDQQALQVQYALWQLLGAVDSPRGEQAAQDIVAQAGTTPPASPAGAQSVIEAAQAGQVRLAVTQWQAIGQPVQITQTATDNFYGRGTLTVENTGQQPLTLYVPIGAVFPAVNQAEQDMVGYATNVETSDPPVGQAQATAAPTQAATATAAPTQAATATVAPTQAATATAAPTQVATATPAAPTTLPNTSGGGGSALLLMIVAGLLMLAAGGRLARGLLRR